MNLRKNIFITSIIFSFLPIYANACCKIKNLESDPIISAWIKADKFAKNGSKIAARNRDVIFTFLNNKQLSLLQKYISKELNINMKKPQKVSKKENLASNEQKFNVN